MSRIRSVHPGLATDEVYMAMTMPAKAAWPLLWTECDDCGAFEWKPLVLKARIFPADNIDFETILAEFERLGCVTSYEHGGRKFGLVRNFTLYQRPKKPQSRHFIPDELRTFSSPSKHSTEPVPNRSPTSSELSPQMEDGEGGGRKKEKEYAFEAGVIRLTERDFNNWKAAFSYLDLRAELVGASKWAGEQGQNWFHAVSGLLAKRNREAKAAADRAKDSGFKLMSGREGII